MKKGLTEIVMILDRSGSMSGLESDTIGGFNAMIKKQREEEGEAIVSTVLFDHERKVIHDRIDIDDVPEMTTKEYYVGGSTALIDAIGCSIKHISNVHKYIRKEDVPEKTIFVISTDGYENSSHIYSSKEVKDMIAKKKKHGWDFIFLGADIDSVETAKHFGIDEDRTASYVHDSVGVGCMYDAVSYAVSGFRKGGRVRKDWNAEVNMDHLKRDKKNRK